MQRIEADAGSQRCSYIGGSDARIVLGTDENALIRLWKEKRGELEPEDLSGNLLVQFGCATEDLNRRWFERETGCRLRAVQRFVRHPQLDWMGATLDGLVEEREGGVRGQVHVALGVYRGKRGREA